MEYGGDAVAWRAGLTWWDGHELCLEGAVSQALNNGRREERETGERARLAEKNEIVGVKTDVAECLFCLRPSQVLGFTMRAVELYSGLG